MAKVREIYYCEHCGLVVETINDAETIPVCCGEKMIKLEAKTEDLGKEKHIPIIEENEYGITVKVGSIDHPMEENHYIKFIELLTKDQIIRAELIPGQSPEAKFCCIKKTDVIEVREFCTIHGLWKG